MTQGVLMSVLDLFSWISYIGTLKEMYIFFLYVLTHWKASSLTWLLIKAGL